MPSRKGPACRCVVLLALNKLYTISTGTCFVRLRPSQQHTCSRRYGPRVCRRSLLGPAATPRYPVARTSSSSCCRGAWPGRRALPTTPRGTGRATRTRGASFVLAKRCLAAGRRGAGSPVPGPWSAASRPAQARAGRAVARSSPPAATRPAVTTAASPHVLIGAASARRRAPRGSAAPAPRRTCPVRGWRRRRGAAADGVTAYGVTEAGAAPAPSRWRVAGRLHGHGGGELQFACQLAASALSGAARAAAQDFTALWCCWWLPPGCAGASVRGSAAPR